MRTTLRVLAVVFGWSCLAVPMAAHHSWTADYDASKPVTVKGVVTKVEWTNPHTHFYIESKDEKRDAHHVEFRDGQHGRARAQRVVQEDAPARRRGDDHGLRRQGRDRASHCPDHHHGRRPRALCRQAGAIGRVGQVEKLEVGRYLVYQAGPPLRRGRERRGLTQSAPRGRDRGGTTDSPHVHEAHERRSTGRRRRRALTESRGQSPEARTVFVPRDSIHALSACAQADPSNGIGVPLRSRHLDPDCCLCVRSSPASSAPSAPSGTADPLIATRWELGVGSASVDWS